ncbi:hypothetical protein CW700_07200 [Candidatus Bathyarchaeota archaeon]|nr:MAG: hypothetical protein CW700_07200 [Candidatus Bathyarchaeota archaeon]
MEPSDEDAEGEDDDDGDYGEEVEPGEEVLEEGYVLDGEVVGRGDEGDEPHRETQVSGIPIPEVVPSPKHQLLKLQGASTSFSSKIFELINKTSPKNPIS